MHSVIWERRRNRAKPTSIQSRLACGMRFSAPPDLRCADTLSLIRLNSAAVGVAKQLMPAWSNASSAARLRSCARRGALGASIPIRVGQSCSSPQARAMYSAASLANLSMTVWSSVRALPEPRGGENGRSLSGSGTKRPDLHEQIEIGSRLFLAQATSTPMKPGRHVLATAGSLWSIFKTQKASPRIANSMPTANRHQGRHLTNGYAEYNVGLNHFCPRLDAAAGFPRPAV